MENKLNLTCEEAISQLKAIAISLTNDWNNMYNRHIPIKFDFNYRDEKEAGICKDSITENFPHIVIKLRRKTTMLASGMKAAFLYDT